MPRAVVDANVFVSAVISSRGSPAKVLEALKRDAFQLVVSEAILEEIRRVLSYAQIQRRHGWSKEQVDQVVDDLRRTGVVTKGGLRLEVVAEDPADNRYLECAVEGDADFIVSGDRHLLELGAYEGIRILSAREFLAGLVAR